MQEWSKLEIEISEVKDIKDALLAKKQGEALERITWPRDFAEGVGLGYYGPQTVLALGSLKIWEDVVNNLAGLFDHTIHDFCQTIGISSGSRNAKRMEKGLETIGQLGQYIPGIPAFDRPVPIHLPAPETKKK